MGLTCIRFDVFQIILENLEDKPIIAHEASLFTDLTRSIRNHIALLKQQCSYIRSPIVYSYLRELGIRWTRTRPAEYRHRKQQQSCLKSLRAPNASRMPTIT